MDTATQTAAAHLQYVLRIADSSLILGQRLSEWCGHGPVIEEDIALTNVALDLIGQARLLLTHAGRLEGAGRDEDALAFLRGEGEFRNVSLVELPNEDFARTILRNFLYAAFQAQLWEGLVRSADTELAAIAAKSAKETRYHLQHAAEWTLRLGDGTAESHARTQRALDYLWPYTAELFTPTAEDEAVAAAGIGPAWPSLQAAWEARVVPLLQQATLTVPKRTPFVSHGKLGRHTEFLGRLLAEMQYLQRTYPGARW
ncbi:MAG TPA: 1,2-phenylacetyl-CoA epoxidase subunit PaaC [Burkholderiaceae bacterium]|nr:1,2-phenylacetyl-CoA epoxidase subunit PaaC [Burkholderiaceae bacterium]